MLKLSLRDLFWLVLVYALVVGWWVDRSNLAATISRLMDLYQTPVVYDLPILQDDGPVAVETKSPEPPVLESEAHEGRDPL
jgi:hypothetical protein